MIRIVKAATLNVLREDAKRACDLARSAERQCEQAKADIIRAQEAVTAAKAELAASENDLLNRLSRMKVAASDPDNGRNFIGELALTVLRNQIASIRASGHEQAIEAIRPMETLLGEGGVFEEAWMTRSHDAGRHVVPEQGCPRCATEPAAEGATPGPQLA
jgi:hypothetical protein